MNTQELSAAVADILHVDAAELAARRFTELIGDSLAALEFSDRVFEQLGVQIDLGIFYRSNSVAVAVQTMSSLDQDQGDSSVDEADHG